MSDLSTLHWQVLKRMMEDAGLEWVSKLDAIEKLDKLGAVSPEVVDAPAAVKVVKPSTGLGFDKNQPFGQICGEIDDAPGACYMQNGTYFNSSGEVVGKV